MYAAAVDAVATGDPSANLSYTALSAPAVLLFGDDPARRARFAALVTAAAARLVADAPVADAAERIGRHAGPGAVVLVDLAEDSGRTLDDLLIRLQAAAIAGRFRVILIVAWPLTDIVTARIADPAATILIAPDAEAVSAALSQALEPWPQMLGESADEASNRRLAQLSEEVGRIARTLAALSGSEDGEAAHGEGLSLPATDPVPAISTEPAAASDIETVRLILRLRRLRDQFFQPALFADPAWDILLDLMAAQIERRRVAVSSLCIAAAVPPTTALRWITAMTDQGLLARRPDPDDGRRIFITLTDSATAAMRLYLTAARRHLARAG